jgi:hypothetical protein
VADAVAKTAGRDGCGCGSAARPAQEQTARSEVLEATE